MNSTPESEGLIFEKSSEGREGVALPECDVEEVKPEEVIPQEMVRGDIDGFPELSELDTVRHFTRLSQRNFGIDTVFYPLGSCTMKYNPKVNEDIAAMSGFSGLHPYQPVELSQGALELICEMEGCLAEINGMDAVTLHPAAGAQGEFLGMLMLSAYFRDRGETRRKVIIPDTAHGTNPASCRLAGFTVTPVKSGRDGIITPESIAAVMDEETAAIMLTNPNTLGLFERHIEEIAEIVRGRGGLVYCDGANLNATMGIARAGDMGVDIIQLNLHKTFSTPHGGGGPGSGPVGVKSLLEPYLPKPRVKREGKRYLLDDDFPKSVGRLRAFHMNFGVVVRAYSYIRTMGGEGLKRASEMAVLNANYLRNALKGSYHLPYEGPCMHESVFTDKLQSEGGVTTMDIAKRLIDYGFHPPTVYFPLVVPGAIMIEPTETESRETLDRFIEAMKGVAREAEEEPELVKEAPHTTRVGRLDEVKAARSPQLRWRRGTPSSG
ncbi:MAG: aminomethyl-transferring glycine dehydrogenase subunit GcvPB [Thermodesulfobacteriota bacterium]